MILSHRHHDIPFRKVLWCSFYIQPNTLSELLTENAVAE